MRGCDGIRSAHDAPGGSVETEATLCITFDIGEQRSAVQIETEAAKRLLEACAEGEVSHPRRCIAKRCRSIGGGHSSQFYHRGGLKVLSPEFRSQGITRTHGKHIRPIDLEVVGVAALVIFTDDMASGIHGQVPSNSEVSC